MSSLFRLMVGWIDRHAAREGEVLRSYVRYARALFVYSGFVAAAGCGQTKIRAIERAPGGGGPGSVEDASALVDTGASSDAGSDGAAVVDRGRVVVHEGNVLTDKGTRLRGVTIPLDVTPAFPLTDELFTALSKRDGLNAVHTYLENRNVATGARMNQADTLVEMTSRAGMYLIIGLGSGSPSGSFDIDTERAFWSLYAPRYKDRTHVLYELQNFPERGCDMPLSAATLAMENEVYGLIRASAPDSHVLLLSYGDIPTADVLGDAIGRLAGIDWSKASVAMHSNSGCVALADLPPVLSVARTMGIAVVVSELWPQTVLPTATLEAQSVGWFNFHWLTADMSADTFRQQYADAGITWCPDFGDWPEPPGCATP